MAVYITSTKKGRNKYNAQRTEYKGITYDSKHEAEYAMVLDSDLRQGRLKEVRRQTRIALVVDGEKICDYVIDFDVIHKDGTRELIEVKGFETAVWKLKYKLFKATFQKKHLDVKYTIIR